MVVSSRSNFNSDKHADFIYRVGDTFITPVKLFKPFKSIKWCFDWIENIQECQRVYDTTHPKKVLWSFGGETGASSSKILTVTTFFFILSSFGFAVFGAFKFVFDVGLS